MWYRHCRRFCKHYKASRVRPHPIGSFQHFGPKATGEAASLVISAQYQYSLVVKAPEPNCDMVYGCRLSDASFFTNKAYYRSHKTSETTSQDCSNKPSSAQPQNTKSEDSHAFLREQVCCLRAASGESYYRFVRATQLDFTVAVYVGLRVLAEVSQKLAIGSPGWTRTPSLYKIFGTGEAVAQAVVGAAGQVQGAAQGLE